MLNETEQKKLHGVLKDAESRILSTAQSTIELSRARSSDQGRDSIDQSNSEELLSTQLRLADREQKLLNKVRKAIKRLEENTIDVCEDCGDSIAFKRLLARPVTTQCIACKEEAEEAERLRGDGNEPDKELLSE